MLFLYQVTGTSGSHEAELEQGRALFVRNCLTPLPRCSSDDLGAQAGCSGLGLDAAEDLDPLG